MSEMKTVLITGATSGIGLETARYLHRRGDYRLVLVGRNEAKLTELSNELKGELFFSCDLEETEKIKELFTFIQAKELKMDGMVHAAGFAANMPIKSLKMGLAEKQMRLHYYAFLELCKYFYSKKISNEGASIVAMSSLATETKLKGSVMYVSSKSALNAAVSIASKEFLRRSIRVNALMPAYVDTRMNDGLEDLIDIKEKQPMGLIPPCSIADTIEFLLSDRSKYITGICLPISAGMEF